MRVNETMNKIMNKSIYILSGFLGSGKTTLLNKLLKTEAFANTLVIINEFGEISLDHMLIEESSDTILELSNGCLCCSIRGELVDTLLKLDPNTFDRIIIETTGIADPLPIYQSLAFHPDLSRQYAPAEIISVYDCARGATLLEDNEEAIAQIAMADVILPTKQDMQPEGSEFETEIRRYNQTALIIPNSEDLSPNLISQRTVKSETSSGKSAHGSTYRSLTLETTKPLSLSMLAGLLHHMTGTVGDNLLRIKGFVLSEEHPQRPILVQVSGQIVHDFIIKDEWHDKPSTQLVVIIKNMDTQKIKTIFDGFMNTLAIDTPDQNAITQNPLAMPGFEL